jgi:hypothetical protein
LPPLFLTTRKLEAGICLAIINIFYFIATITFQPYLTDTEDKEHQRLHNRTSVENLKAPKKCSRKRCGVNVMLDACLLIAEFFLSIGCILTAVDGTPVGVIGFFEWTAVVIFIAAILFLMKESFIHQIEECKTAEKNGGDTEHKSNDKGKENEKSVEEKPETKKTKMTQVLPVVDEQNN